MTPEEATFADAVTKFQQKLRAESVQGGEEKKSEGADWQDGFTARLFPTVAPHSKQKVARTIFPCTFIFTATLGWNDLEDADLDLYVKADDDSTVFYDHLSGTDLSLNHDCHPTCNPEPTGDEIITGTYTDVYSKSFLVWYNQYSDCAPEVTPARARVKIENTGTTPLYVNGAEVAAGSSTTLNGLAYGGYAAGQQTSLSGATEINITT